MSDWQKILIAVNDSDDALRAVKYVGNFAAEIAEVELVLVCVFPDPPPDYYTKGGTLEAYEEVMKYQADKALDIAVKDLNKSGVNSERITREIQLADGHTISNVILDAREKHGCNTLVVGKRGISKNEEFLFGSISNTLARKSGGFTTWVVG